MARCNSEIREIIPHDCAGDGFRTIFLGAGALVSASACGVLCGSGCGGLCCFWWKNGLECSGVEKFFVDLPHSMCYRFEQLSLFVDIYCRKLIIQGFLSDICFVINCISCF